MIEVTKDILKKIYKPRPRNSKKYDFGLLIVIGGSDFYSGSPALAAMAAFKAGVDMVRIIAPKRAADIIASFSPNLAAYPLEGAYLTKKHLATLLSMTESAKVVARGNTAVVIGGGMGRSEETKRAILEYLEKVQIPVVIDADAIHALSEKPEIISGRNFLITPHTYEFFVLTGKEVYKLPEEEKIKMVCQEAARLQTTILLKGPTDIISDGKEVALNRTGCSLMTVGGMGDTLAGIAGALLARRVDLFSAGQAAAFVNGLAGESAGKKLGESVTATDLIDEIPNVLPKF
ncbi:MAG: NAD(P)H-hydrate dehydratase [Candidatus Nealsonbacteria bacterium CG23_combo_of_CG06-09_8_20_14_all_38_19]|uniref:ADP-dependent (S)-NAD(P)H-hydrate dehydratase n=1 Tax=Candidatus Nealsonbacteria bacterium CG23_combo_of_CG06-09_8_20_14_all_38_19 TaxID=1974721 RepID=A0A2G9YWR3_9BACT|nr:MAG: NAD(P)H-hydrate dehydratase [Candidatus Nealsonbacteria bacterium CG23_combo_of_CG06-09_8_20_14_all_38_19]